ncbi:hypothetical protein [Variovorax sp. RA8]|uniref:hypothetical protein n=1 Tax=Variovorax sp. (strain JCM 16519 / RA8) TaxID=662548 RepID=UPI0013A54E96|nr:hypothetical protein [Variovorax sp. RA8]
MLEVPNLEQLVHTLQLLGSFIDNGKPTDLSLMSFTSMRTEHRIAQPHASGQTYQSWLWAASAKHSTRQISEVLERIEVLRGLDACGNSCMPRNVVCQPCIARLLERGANNTPAENDQQPQPIKNEDRDPRRRGSRRATA